MLHLSLNTVDYMGQVWGFASSTGLDYLAMLWNESKYELLAKRMVDAGAVEENCPAAREMVRVARSILIHEEKSMIDECLDVYTPVQCDECCYVHFVPQSIDVGEVMNGDCEGCGRNGTLNREERQDIHHDYA